MPSERSLLIELERTFAGGSADRQADILRRITDLFLAGAGQYNDEQVGLFDGVILRLAEKIETKARAELANRLAPEPNAPPSIVRRLARDPSIEVAEPVLRQSTRLDDADLLAIADEADRIGGHSDGQDRLLAISKRAAISETVSDVLVTRGNRNVVLSVTQNQGASISDAGYGRLVDRSLDDEVLTICVGMRRDIPRQHFQSLISQASQVVLAKLEAANPTAVADVRKVLADITGQPVSAPSAMSASYIEAEARFNGLRQAGKSADAIVQELSATGQFAGIVAALVGLAQAPREFVESVMNDRRGDNDFALLLARAAGLSWPSAMQICILRRGPGGLPPLALEAARLSYARLKPDTARRVIHFYNERHTALDDFQLLAAQIGAQANG
ncbi:MAG: DUF2336 domain-containing protein [Rhodopseudomonas sp.]|nr:DUF2336 domain-containing protein [Rhodopseudomonas sp.]